MEVLPKWAYPWGFTVYCLLPISKGPFPVFVHHLETRGSTSCLFSVWFPALGHIGSLRQPSFYLCSSFSNGFFIRTGSNLMGCLLPLWACCPCICLSTKQISSWNPSPELCTCWKVPPCTRFFLFFYWTKSMCQWISAVMAYCRPFTLLSRHNASSEWPQMYSSRMLLAVIARGTDLQFLQLWSLRSSSCFSTPSTSILRSPPTQAWLSVHLQSLPLWSVKFSGRPSLKLGAPIFQSGILWHFSFQILKVVVSQANILISYTKMVQR